MRGDLYVIESRDGDGQLLFRDAAGQRLPMPETVFGDRAITGITEDAMAQIIFRKKPDAVLDGRFLLDWPAIINPNWKARRKTW